MKTKQTQEKIERETCIVTTQTEIDVMKGDNE
jgi:hypothetical protein